MFIPTFLYVKRHSMTGKLYFGKTINPDPVKYPGSGKHWSPHVKKHGYEHIETLWYCLFTEKEELTKFALMFSEQAEIVKSDLWLNLKPENGIDGTLPGSTKSPETRRKMSEGMKGKIKSAEHRANLSKASIGKSLPKEVCAKMSASKTGKKLPQFSKEHREKLSVCAKNRNSEWHAKQSLAQRKIVSCPHCTKEGTIAIMKRWHFNHCKHKLESVV